jgi:DNA-binding response OmpR family regulator
MISGQRTGMSLKGVRVLIVEDGWQVANALKYSLEKLGMVVVGLAATSEEARRLSTDFCLDLAMVDVNLKGEMAYSLMDQLHVSGVPVIAMTAYEELPSSLEIFAAVLRKPFTSATLLATLRRVLS